MNRQPKREAQRMQNHREELVERMGRALPEDGSSEALPGFFLSRSSKPTESVSSVHQPAFCFVAQGCKRVLLGEELFRYDPGHYLIFTVDLPVVFKVEEASSAGFRVGYEDPSYFSREYKKLFGAPPQRDISRFRDNR